MGSMRTKLQCADPREIEFSLTITMQAKDWERLREQLLAVQGSPWPLWEVRDHVGKLLEQANSVFTANSKEADGE